MSPKTRYPQSINPLSRRRTQRHPEGPVATLTSKALLLEQVVLSMHKFYSQVAHQRWQDFEPGMGKRRACASPSSTPALSNCSYENQNVVLGCNLKRQQDKRKQTDRYATVARIMVPLCVLTARTSSTGYSTTSVSSNVRSNPKSVILSAILADREWLVRSLIVKRQVAPVIMFNFQYVSTIFIS